MDDYLDSSGHSGRGWGAWYTTRMVGLRVIYNARSLSYGMGANIKNPTRTVLLGAHVARRRFKTPNAIHGLSAATL